MNKIQTLEIIIKLDLVYTNKIMQFNDTLFSFLTTHHDDILFRLYLLINLLMSKFFLLVD